MIELTEEQLRHIATIQPDTSRRVPPELLDYKLLCRQNTGISICDSGGDHGRAWQQPAPSDEPVVWEAEYMAATLQTHIVLRGCWPIDKELTTEYWQKFERVGQYLDEELPGTATDVEVCHAFLLSKGYRYEYGDNTYNDELSNLTQDVAYDRYEHDALPSLVSVRIHNGADIRGGYTTPVIAYPDDIGGPHPCQAGYQVYRGFRADGTEIPAEELEAETWSPSDRDFPYDDMTENIKLLPYSINEVAFPGIRKDDGALVFVYAGDGNTPPRHFRDLETLIMRETFREEISPRLAKWLREVERYLYTRNDVDREAQWLLTDLSAMILQEELR